MLFLRCLRLRHGLRHLRWGQCSTSNFLASTSFLRSPAPTSPAAAASRLLSSRDPAQRTGRAGRFLYCGFHVRPTTGATPPLLLSADSSLRLRHTSLAVFSHPFCDALCKQNPRTLQASGTISAPGSLISAPLSRPQPFCAPAFFHGAFAPRHNAPETSSMTPRILPKFATVLYVLRRRPLPSTSHRKTTMLPPNIYSAFHALAIVSRLAWLIPDRDETLYSYCLAREGLELRAPSLKLKLPRLPPVWIPPRLHQCSSSPFSAAYFRTLCPSNLTAYTHTDTAPISILEILRAAQVNHRTLRLCMKTAPRQDGACVPPLRSSSHVPCSAFFAVVFSCLLLPRSHPTPSHRPTALRDSVSGRVCHSLSITALLENQTCPLPPMLRYSFR
ncbi:hypothetical protein K438DRAFT_1972801 [Mycena galopus ATCC 62051]|nr:hypothetical protein K438DRAFT_1972801 [Mycena galopus ATCC 62051]